MVEAPGSGPLVGIVAGPGLFPVPADAETLRVHTPYELTSAPVTLTRIAGTRVALLPSQAKLYLSPALLPARANAWALASLGVKAVIMVTAAGGLRHEYAPGAFVISGQIIDRTWGRPNTFHDQGRLIQLAAPSPFDGELHRLAISALEGESVRIQPTGTVVVTQ